MTSFYKRGVLTNDNHDPVASRYRAALVERLGAERTDAVLGMNRFNNIVYPNLVINAQNQQMRVTIPVAADLTLVRIHCFRLKGAPEEMFHRAIRFLDHHRLAGIDDLLGRRGNAGTLPARSCEAGGTLGELFARSRQRPPRRRRQHLRRGQ